MLEPEDEITKAEDVLDWSFDPIRPNTRRHRDAAHGAAIAINEIRKDAFIVFDDRETGRLYVQYAEDHFCETTLVEALDWVCDRFFGDATRQSVLEWAEHLEACAASLRKYANDPEQFYQSEVEEKAANVE